MKWQAIHQEILLIIDSSLSIRHFCKKNNSNHKYSPVEELEKACWDGLLYELLPGIIECPSSNGMSYIWEIASTQKFLHISMGTCPSYVEYETSLDPYFFLEIVNLN
ncbi:MAG: hypothetical protein ACHQEB_02390 [Chitinophagales bacterium]